MIQDSSELLDSDSEFLCGIFCFRNPRLNVSLFRFLALQDPLALRRARGLNLVADATTLLRFGQPLSAGGFTGHLVQECCKGTSTHGVPPGRLPCPPSPYMHA